MFILVQRRQAAGATDQRLKPAADQVQLTNRRLLVRVKRALELAQHRDRDAHDVGIGSGAGRGTRNEPVGGRGCLLDQPAS